jgi:hypothetical protein
VVDRFLIDKERKRDAGAIVERTDQEFVAAGFLVADAFGWSRQVPGLTQMTLVIRNKSHNIPNTA